MEGDRAHCKAQSSKANFYPRPPGGGRLIALKDLISKLHFYPRPPGGGRPKLSVFIHAGSCISIHALRVEGDVHRRFCYAGGGHFYPRPPGGGRRVEQTKQKLDSLFLSTPSGWRATRSPQSRYTCRGFLSTPSGWRATTEVFGPVLGNVLISIHALRVEGDSTSRYRSSAELISIHALRVEGDDCSAGADCHKGHFYPRPPGGGRQQKQTKFSSVFAQKGEEFASLRRGKRKFAGGVLKRTNFGF